MTLVHHGWGWQYPGWSTLIISIRYIKSVWAIGMLSQGHMGAPLYHSISQVGPKFGILGSPMWSENYVSTSWLRLISTSDHQLHTSILDIIYKIVWAMGMLSQGHTGAPLYHYTSQVGPRRYGDSGSLVESKWCHSVMFAADIHLRPLHTSIVDIQSVWASSMLSQGYKGTPAYLYTIQVGPRFWNSGSLVEWKYDVFTSWLRLTSTSDCFPFHIRYIQNVWAIGMLPQGYMGAPL